MSSFSESIPCQVVKITAEELDVRFSQAFQTLRPGMLLRFENGRASSGVLYGRLEALKREAPPKAGAEADVSVLAKIEVVLGDPDFSLSQAMPLSSDALAHEAAGLIGELNYPIRLGESFTADFAQYNTLTVLSGPSLDEKMTALAHWLEGLKWYQRLVIIDPLGILEEELLPHMPKGMGSVVKAGVDAGLSLQSVGIKRFLGALSSMLPDVIRSEAIQLLAEVLPIGQTFVPFKELLRVETLTDRPSDHLQGGPSRQALSMKTPLLNCLYDIDRQRVFADSPREVLSLHQALRSQVTIIDLAGLSEPWKTLFYEEISFEVLANAGGDIMPVFVYPENYLADFPDYIKKLNEADISALVLASPYCSNELPALADNHMYWNAMGDLILEGTMTFDLPVQLDLTHLPTSWGNQSQEGFYRLPALEASPPPPSLLAESPYDSASYDAEADPLQARYSQQSVIAPPTPSGHLSSYDMDEEDVEEAIGASAYFESDAWQQTVSQIAAQAGIDYTGIPDDAPSGGFDSILGGSVLGDMTPEEVGGAVLRPDPEFVPPDRLRSQAAQEDEQAFPEALDADDAFGQDIPILEIDATSGIQATEAAAAAFQDDFNFDLGLLSDVPLPETATSIAIQPEAAAETLDYLPEEYLPGFDTDADAGLLPVQGPILGMTPAPANVVTDDLPPVRPKSLALLDTEETPLENTSGKNTDANAEGQHGAFELGERVRSDKYGEGVVQKLIPMDSATAVHVLFDSGAKRTIMPTGGNLQRI